MAVTQLEKDCALMAGVADRATRPNEINQFPVPTGWVKFPHETHPSGFEATYFKKGNQIVISFAGTNTNFLSNDGLGDLITDIEEGLGNATTQLVQAAEYYMNVKNNNPEVTEFIFTGHSLGGGLAALMGEFFNEKAIVFDPAPFANAANVNVKMAILDHLQGIPYQYVDPYSGNAMMIDRPRLYSKKYNLDEINILAQDLRSFTNESVAARRLNVGGYYMQGEFCRYFPIADEYLNASKEIKHNVPGIGGDCRPWGWPLKLHSLSLLTSFMIDNRLSGLSAKIPGLLDMLFDSRLYYYDKKAKAENFLERLVRHQAGNAPLNGGGVTEADDMLIRFTNDLQKIADQGDLSTTDEKIIKTLTAFAMQMYYENPDASGASNNTKQLFNFDGIAGQAGGLHFSMSDVLHRSDADTKLEDSKGYTRYLRNYLNFIPGAEIDLSALETIKTKLHELLQWYVQIGNTPMTATAANQNAFMLGGNGADNLTGGSDNDVLMGGKEADTLAGGAGNDTLIGNSGNDSISGGDGDDVFYGHAGNDTLIGGAGHDTYRYTINDGNDTIIDTGSNRIEIYDLEGRRIQSDVFYKKDDNTWANTSGKVNVVGNKLVLADGSEITLVDANLQAGDFGINLIPIPANPEIGSVIYLDVIDPGNTNHWNEKYGSSGNDQIVGGSYHDEVLNTSAGGNDWLTGGAGNDIVQTFGVTGDCILEGNAGVDALLGYGGSDRIFCGDYGEMIDLIAAGETAISLAETGDLAEGSSGNDFIYGSNAYDGLFGGSGNDLLVGGGGDDVIYGDCGSFGVNPYGGFPLAYWTWSYTVDFEVDTNTYTVHFNNIAAVDFPAVYEAGDDVIYAGTGNDYVNASAGNDEIYGGEGSDTLFGDIGNDFIEGGDGNDYLFGDGGVASDIGDDYIDGGGGTDYIQGQNGSDDLFGGADNDTIYGNDGDDYLDGEANNDILFGQRGNDQLFGGDGNDNLNGDDTNLQLSAHGNDYLDGEAGDDTLYGQGGNDELFGGDGLDLLDGGQGDDYLDGEAGNDTLSGAAGSDELFGDEGDDFLHGDAANVAEADQGADYIDGEAGNDYIVGYGGDDTLYGSDGNDTIYGGAGNDVIDGGDDNDTLDGGAGDNEIYGGNGNDSIYTSAGNSYIEGGAGDDNIIAGDGANTIYGDDGIDWLQGGAGNDYIQGGLGADTLLGGAGDNTMYGDEGNDQIQGGAGADYIDGGLDADYIVGLEGNDQIYGGDGNDSIWGGIGNDTISGEAGDDQLAGEEGDDTLYGDAGNDLLDGGAGNNNLDGGGGDDTVLGGSDADTIYGGTGNDYLKGNGGNDTYQFGRGSGVDVIDNASTDYASTLDTVQFGAGISTTDLELAQSGNDLQINIKGTTDSLVFVGWFNGITYQVDQFQFADNTVLTYSQLVEAYSSTYYGTSADESLSGTIFNDIIFGYEGNDAIYGGAGNDTLIGGTGNDNLQGGVGNDTYLFGRGSGQDQIIDHDAAVGNVDTIILGSDVVPADVILNRVNTNLVLSINDTSDTLTVLDWFLDTGSRQVEHIQLADGTIWAAATIRQAVFHATEGSDSIYGYETADVLSGLGGDDTLYGYGGNDTLDGGTGNDFLLGGVGDDTYLFGRGSGQDRIGDSDTMAGNVDTIILDNNIIPSDIVLSRLDANLKLSIFGTTDTLEINNWFSSSGEYQVERIQFADGTIWDAAAIKQTTSQPTEGDDYLEGTSTADLIIGLGGNDKLYGYGGNDTIVGGAGNDQLYDGDGNDTLDGGAGNDYLHNTAGNDTILLGRNSGNDVVYYEYGATTGEIDTILLDAGILPEDVILWRYDDWGDTKLMLSIATIPSLPSSETDRFVSITTRRNEILPATTASIMINDWFMYYPAAAPYPELATRIQFADGTIWEADQIYNWYLQGNEGDDIIFGYAISDTINGNGGDDQLYGGGGNDALYGGDGTDWLYGDNGNDTLDGGPGGDTLSGGVGNDVYLLNRGSGYGEIFESYEDPSQIDTILLGANIQLTDVLLKQNEYDNLIVSISGAEDYMEVADYFADGGGYQIDRIQFADGTIWDADYIQQHLQPEATEGDDTLTGTIGVDYIEGLGGNDYLTGLAGDDVIDGGTGADTMIGGAGNDEYYIDEPGDIITENENDGLDTVYSSITYTLGSNVENLTLMDTAAINGTGNTLDNYLIGNSAVNTLTGYAGNDTLDGGAGADNLIGGADDDTYIINNTGVTITENTGEGTDTVESSRTFTLGSNIENLTLTGENSISGTGNSMANLITGNEANNTISGGTGADTMIGVAGDDTYVIDDAGDVVTENFDEGTDTVKSSINYTLGSNVENLTLTGTNAINGTGNELANTLTGNLGANILDGGMDADNMIGGAGNDTYIVDDAGDVVTESTGAGTDTIQSSISYTLMANVENLTLTGTNAINATGNELANTITGNSAANILDGGTGNDTIIGGTGNDTYLFGRGYGQDTVNDTDTTVGNLDKIILAAGVATTEVLLTRSGDNLLVSINGTTDSLTVQNWFASGGANRLEQIVFEGGAVWDEAYILANATTGGTSGNDNLTGTTGADLLSGLAGNDTLTGLAGDDTLDGGTGADSMIGGAGNDTYIRDNTSDVITEGSSAGTDTVLTNLTYTLVSNVENLTLTGTNAINGTGNTLANYLTGNSAVNTLTGSSGNDTLDGGAGADSLVGGTGNDTYIIDNTGDKVSETSSSGGTDIIMSSVTYTLPSNVEKLTLIGTSAINATGNTLANTLTGNSGINTLSGGSGNDTLDGGLGNDSLTGGSGSDMYTFRTGSGLDTVDNYDTSTSRIDTIRFDDVASTGLRGTRRSGNDLIVEYGTSDSITIKNHYSGTSYQISRFTFSNGVTWTSAQLLAAYPAATMAQGTSLMTVNSVATPETKSSVAGLYQNDVYENGYLSSLHSFMEKVRGGHGEHIGDSLALRAHYSNYGTHRLEVSDGYYITRTDIESIVNTMSAINNNTGMDVMQKYNAMMADQSYISTLAATWKQM